MLEIRVLGHFSVRREGEELDIKMHPDGTLLAYLVLNPGNPYPREKLSDIFWPQDSEEAALRNLRSTLKQLRTILGSDPKGGEDYILSENNAIVFNTRVEYWSDIQSLMRGIGEDTPAKDIMADLAHYGGDFLPGLSHDWIILERERLNGIFERKMSALLELLVRESRWVEIQEWSERWIALGRAPEPAYRALMMAHAAQKDIPQVVQTYQRCLEGLRHQNKLEPSQATRETFEWLLQGGTVFEGLDTGDFSISQFERETAIGVKREKPITISSQFPEISVGTMLNHRYRLDAELGRGGMGIVFRGHDSLLDRDVAIKVLSRFFQETESYQRIISEAQTIAKINHPNIVAVYDAGEEHGLPYIVMELLQGESPVTDPIRPIEEVIDIALQICEGLNQVHERGIVHRDIKPENVMVLQGKKVKLMDFGLARYEASRLTQEGEILGTVFYLAPEQALGRKIDPRTDIYAIGVLLYEMTTGRLPFTGEGVIGVITQHLHTSPVPPVEITPDLPYSFSNLILRMLSKDPEDRPTSLMEVIEELRLLKQGFLDGQSWEDPIFLQGGVLSQSSIEKPKTGVYLLLDRWRHQGIEVLDIPSLALVHGSPDDVIFDEQDSILLVRSALHRQVDVDPWLEKTGSEARAASVLGKLIEEYPKPNIRLKIVQALDGLDVESASQTLFEIATSDEAPAVRTAAAVSVAQRDRLDEIIASLLHDLREKDDVTALSAFVAVADEVGLPQGVENYPKMTVSMLLLQRRLQAKGGRILRQGVMAAFGASLLSFLNGLAAPLYIYLSYPRDFQETLKFMTVPAWMISGALGLFFMGGLQGFASGLGVGFADAIWRGRSSKSIRYIIGGLAGLIIGLLLILYNMFRFGKPPTAPQFYNTIYLVYGICLGVALAIALPHLDESLTLRHRLFLGIRGSIIAVIATILYVMAVYRDDAMKELPQNLMIAISLTLGINIMLKSSDS